MVCQLLALALPFSPAKYAYLLLAKSYEKNDATLMYGVFVKSEATAGGQLS